MKRVWACLTGLVLLGILALGWQHYHLRQQIQSVLALEDQYRILISRAKRNGRQPVSPQQNGQGLISEEYAVPGQSLSLVNRSPGYLRDVTLSYLNECGVTDSASYMGGDWWLEYTDYLMNGGGVYAAPQKRAVREQKKKTPKPQRNQIVTVSDAVVGRLRGQFAWPIPQQKFWLSSPFGPRKKPNGSWGFHRGIDMAASRGTPVCAAAAGQVIEARYAPGYGNMVVVSHLGGSKTRYAHLEVIHVAQGQRLKQADRVGDVGDTGFTIKTGKEATHLHFELYDGDTPVDPLRVLKA